MCGRCQASKRIFIRDSDGVLDEFRKIIACIAYVAVANASQARLQDHSSTPGRTKRQTASAQDRSEAVDGGNKHGSTPSPSSLAAVGAGAVTGKVPPPTDRGASLTKEQHRRLLLAQLQQVQGTAETAYSLTQQNKAALLTQRSPLKVQSTGGVDTMSSAPVSFSPPPPSLDFVCF